MDIEQRVAAAIEGDADWKPAPKPRQLIRISGGKVSRAERDESKAKTKLSKVSKRKNRK